MFEEIETYRLAITSVFYTIASRSLLPAARYCCCWCCCCSQRPSLMVPFRMKIAKSTQFPTSLSNGHGVLACAGDVFHQDGAVDDERMEQAWRLLMASSHMAVVEARDVFWRLPATPFVPCLLVSVSGEAAGRDTAASSVTTHFAVLWSTLLHALFRNASKHLHAPWGHSALTTQTHLPPVSCAALDPVAVPSSTMPTTAHVAVPHPISTISAQTLLLPVVAPL